MTLSTAQITRIGLAGGKIAAASGLILALAGISAAPAFGADDHYGPTSQRNAWNHEDSHDANHQNNHQNNHRNQHNTYYRSGGNYDHGDSNYYHGVYRDPYVYAPPPVTYVPAATPGITLFFPLQFR